MPPVAQPFPLALSDSEDAHTHLARACEIGLARGGLALKVYSSNLYPYGLSFSLLVFSALLFERIDEVSHAGCSYVIMDPWNLLPSATRVSFPVVDSIRRSSRARCSTRTLTSGIIGKMREYPTPAGERALCAVSEERVSRIKCTNSEMGIFCFTNAIGDDYAFEERYFTRLEFLTATLIAPIYFWHFSVFFS